MPSWNPPSLAGNRGRCVRRPGQNMQCLNPGAMKYRSWTMARVPRRVGQGGCRSVVLGWGEIGSWGRWIWRCPTRPPHVIAHPIQGQTVLLPRYSSVAKEAHCLVTSRALRRSLSFTLEKMSLRICNSTKNRLSEDLLPSELSFTSSILRDLRPRCYCTRPPRPSLLLHPHPLSSSSYFLHLKRNSQTPQNLKTFDKRSFVKKIVT